MNFLAWVWFEALFLLNIISNDQPAPKLADQGIGSCQYCSHFRYVNHLVPKIMLFEKSFFLSFRRSEATLAPFIRVPHYENKVFLTNSMIPRLNGNGKNFFCQKSDGQHMQSITWRFLLWVFGANFTDTLPDVNVDIIFLRHYFKPTSTVEIILFTQPHMMHWRLSLRPYCIYREFQELEHCKDKTHRLSALG